MVVQPNEEFEDLCCTIKALIISRQEWTSFEVLRKDYREIEGRDIPLHKFGYSNLKSFLQSIPEYVRCENIRGVDYVFQVDNEKSAHISRLVAQQRPSQKKGRGTRRGGAQFRPSKHFPVGGFTRSRLSTEELKYILNLIKCNPQGVSKNQILKSIHDKNQYSQITLSDLEHQLSEMTHELMFVNNLVLPRYPVNFNNQNSATSFIPHQVTKHITMNTNIESPVFVQGRKDRPKNIMPAGFEDEIGQMDEEFVFDSSDYSSYESPKEKQIETDNNAATSNRKRFNDIIDTNDNTNNENNDVNDSNLVSDRIKFRLEKLIQKYEDGIWCADLPELYDKEYKMTLNYMDLGFESVREIAAYLKDIFVLEQPKERGDFKVYYVKNYQKQNKEQPPQKKTLASLYNMYQDYNDIKPAVPEKLTKETCARLIPSEVLCYKETVGQINITDLKDDESVIICEVFDPSFFWIRQVKSMELFNNLMKNIQEFYAEKWKKYLIPPIILEKGLSIACQYRDIWHRGIVKSIRPDNFAYILFYDYGTIKLVSTKELCFLHRKFSHIPALAVPCGLHNVQPYEDNRWVKWVVSEFVDTVLDKPYYIKIKVIDEETNSAMIHLYNENMYVHERMIQNSLAVEGTVVSTSQICNYLLQIDPNCFRKKFENIAPQSSQPKTESISMRRKRSILARLQAMEPEKVSETSESEGESNSRIMRPNERLRLLFFKKQFQNSSKNPPTQNLSSNSLQNSSQNPPQYPVPTDFNYSKIKKISSKDCVNTSDTLVLEAFSPIDRNVAETKIPNELLNLHTILGNNDSPIDWDKLLNNKKNGEEASPIKQSVAPETQERSQEQISREKLVSIEPNCYFSRAVRCDRFYELSKRNICWSTKNNFKPFQSNMITPLEVTQHKKKVLPENTKLVISKELIQTLRSKEKKIVQKSDPPSEDNRKEKVQIINRDKIHTNDICDKDGSISSSESSISDTNSDKTKSIMKESLNLFNTIEPKPPLIVELSSHDFTPDEIEINEQCHKLDSSILLNVQQNEPHNQYLKETSKDFIKDKLRRLHGIANNVLSFSSLTIDSDDISTRPESTSASITDSGDSSRDYAIECINKVESVNDNNYYSSDEEYNFEYDSKSLQETQSTDCLKDLDRWEVVGTPGDFFGERPLFESVNQAPQYNKDSVIISEVTETENVNHAVECTNVLNSTLDTSEVTSTESLQASISSNLDSDSGSIECWHNSSPQQRPIENAKQVIEKHARTLILNKNWEPTDKTKALINKIQCMRRNAQVD